MTVLTLFFCGTGFGSADFYRATYPQGELVATLARNMAGTEYVDWFIVDGPGSGNSQAAEKFVEPINSLGESLGKPFGYGMEASAEHAIQMIRGVATWSPALHPLRNEQLNPGLIRRQQFREDQDARQQVFGQWTAAATAQPGHVMATPASTVVKLKNRSISIPHEKDFNRITRKGATRRKGHVAPNRTPITSPTPFRPTAQQLIMQRIAMARRSRPITAINVVGWSRGAVTAHRFANKLHAAADLRHIPLRIIAVDPVAGFFNYTDKRDTTLPENVVEYICFYACTEKKWWLKPMKPVPYANMRTTFYPVPGGHATIVGKPDVGGEFALKNARLANWSASENAYRLSPALLVRRLTERYLIAWGTKLSQHLPNDDAALLGDYDLMIKSRGKFRKDAPPGALPSSKRTIGVKGLPNKNMSLYAALREEMDTIFINDHHRRLFEKFHPPGTVNFTNKTSPLAPHTYDWLYEYATT
ncbi:hypothetical protein OVY01_14230 [Robbsia sp. Bb-Pol-6]|uniref:Uncharacterized protein n=1 Tax=Robbsia betulipollinis TaxID=2981849 RepID=A0ABT3ZPN9_9BURK|nr:hypothetical protein [Robbsia betulipollinis]MCY0388372.1 hypothetical protein [Robbsia betulipollinis]